MKRSTIYAVYHPLANGLPYLAIVIAPDGTATARPFDTEQEAAAFNKQMAAAGIPARPTIEHLPSRRGNGYRPCSNTSGG
ncbi:MAG: hypothetical protein E5V60_03095 [Mesorhizobium sp.]|nr:hypothetical protein EN781_12250 [Mesorhizobium sp. M4A.F.Ca.ET.090.04.2.1]TIW68886.1 MAG: hypothetical protein E5V60_03095 [Mesorhizobium sp.]